MSICFGCFITYVKYQNYEVYVNNFDIHKNRYDIIVHNRQQFKSKSSIIDGIEIGYTIYDLYKKFGIVAEYVDDKKVINTYFHDLEYVPNVFKVDRGNYSYYLITGFEGHILAIEIHDINIVDEIERKYQDNFTIINSINYFNFPEYEFLHKELKKTFFEYCISDMPKMGLMGNNTFCKTTELYGSDEQENWKIIIRYEHGIPKYCVILPKPTDAYLDIERSHLEKYKNSIKNSLN